MKTAFFLTVLGLAASAAANPLAGKQKPTPCTQCRESILQLTQLTKTKERACVGAAITACQTGCKSVASSYCSSTCGGNPSCNSACYSSRYSSCATCCSTKCKTC